jgi:integrase
MISKSEVRTQLEKSLGFTSEAGLSLSYYYSVLEDITAANPSNAQTLSRYIRACIEQNLAQTSILSYIQILYFFSRYVGFKSFEKASKEDILSYLLSLKKSETDDPTHKWIGTYNVRLMILYKFFRWLYNQNEPERKKWISPPCVQGIRALRKKEKSPYKPSDIWNDKEHSIFLKYCTSKRDCCYHSMAYDTAARPKELRNLRIKDVEFKLSSTGKQYAEVHIKISKTKPRTVPLIFSVPYVKDWINSHPTAGNPNSYLFVSLSDRSYGQKLSGNALYKRYSDDLKNYLKKLSKEGSIPESDRAYMKNMLTKPWLPYIFRHSSLTEKSQILKESTLRSYAGWSTNSNMPNVYLHYYGNESCKSLLEAYGIEDYQKKQVDTIRGKICPNCSEQSKPDSKFCAKCHMVLTYDAYSETIEEKLKSNDDLETLKQQMQTLMSILGSIGQEGKLEIAKQLIEKGIYRRQ